MELTQQQKQLARKIATELDDLDALPYHEMLTQRYSEVYLLERLEYVLSLPREKITRSRAAYYVNLVTKHVNFKNRPRS